MSEETVKEDSRDQDNHQNESKSNLFDATELDDEVLEKLKGDAIEGTVYSKSAILQDIKDIFFTHKNFEDPDTEEKLCNIWDMCADKAVCLFLNEVLFSDIIVNTFTSEELPFRIVEICLGVLGNMCSFDIETKDEHIEQIINWLDTDNIPVLIQVVRIIKNLAHYNDELGFVNKHVMERLLFILNSSLDDELLSGALDALSELTLDFKVNIKDLENVSDLTVITSTLEGYRELISKIGDSDTEVLRNYAYFLQVVLNICCYVEELNSPTLLNDLIKCKVELQDVFFTMIKNEFTARCFEIDEMYKFHLKAYRIIFPVLQTEFNEEIFKVFNERLAEVTDEEIVDDLNGLIEFNSDRRNEKIDKIVKGVENSS